VKALIYTHHPDEGPGLLEEILKERKWEVKEIGFWNGEKIPDPDPFHLLILMGGPMSVSQEDLYPFLVEEQAFVRAWVNEGNPTLGICLGAQLIADSQGSRVYKGIKEEVGWYELIMTSEGKKDPLLGKFPARFPVFQWHGETFDVPNNAILLATSREYPHQAFRYGKHTYAFQFHFEITKDMVQRWLSASEINISQKRNILTNLPSFLTPINRLCRMFMKPFLQSIETQKMGT
jgi:GMP synthase (glutamine-hydrolysing)